MLEFDEELALKKIMEEDHCGEELAQAFIDNGIKKHMNEALYPMFEAWLKGKNPPFEFHGLTLSEIMEKEHESYIGAISRMSFILNQSDPIAEVEWYKNRNFHRK